MTIARALSAAACLLGIVARDGDGRRSGIHPSPFVSAMAEPPRSRVVERGEPISPGNYSRPTSPPTKFSSSDNVPRPSSRCHRSPPWAHYQTATSSPPAEGVNRQGDRLDRARERAQASARPSTSRIIPRQIVGRPEGQTSASTAFPPLAISGSEASLDKHGLARPDVTITPIPFSRCRRFARRRPVYLGMFPAAVLRRWRKQMKLRKMFDANTACLRRELNRPWS